MQAVAGIVRRLLERRRAAVKTSLTGRPLDLGGQSWHKGYPYRDLTGLKERSVATPPRAGTLPEYGHQVGEACCRRGGVAGAEP
ncbi:MAG: hypothetical protein OXF86_13275, partial [Caldilineaceae bacterium]|nr:hypothetical protein [Caldilineaceae bacterium]